VSTHIVLALLKSLRAQSRVRLDHDDHGKLIYDAEFERDATNAGINFECLLVHIRGSVHEGGFYGHHFIDWNEVAEWFAKDSAAIRNCAACEKFADDDCQGEAAGVGERKCEVTP